MRKLAGLEWLYLAFAGCGYVGAAVQYACSVGSLEQAHFRLTVAMVLLAVCLAAALVQVVSDSGRIYLAALAVQVAGTAAALALVAGIHTPEKLLLAVVVLGACLHNPYPLNLILSVLLSVLLPALGAAVLAAAQAPHGDILDTALNDAATGVLLSVFASLMVHFRERLIATQKENARLDGLVDRLVGANLQYQEYAKSVEEASTESERKRITRDIHDVVGYTLTSNITMMEAITDMMSDNPLGVQHLVNAARENAQEGLARIREALRELRAKEVVFPHGAQALRRLIRVFERATGVRVEVVTSEVPWDFPDELDSALYHVVQESLMNSFRHGKASQVRVFLRRQDGEIVLKVTDNGLGAAEFEEGIGLIGMRERLEKFGGTLKVGSVGAGFYVVATVPLRPE